TFVQLSDVALRTCKEMREQLFSKFMNNIGMVSEQGTSDVEADIVLAAVPFGFFTPGDLALLKALENIDETQLSGKEAAFFSMYYAESEQQVKAKQLYNQAKASKATDEELNWVATAEQLIQLHEEATELSFDHVPLGAECPYFAGLNERHPRIVLEDSQVRVGVFMKGAKAKEVRQVYLSYQVNEEPWQEVELNRVVAESGEQVWEGYIPPADKYSQVKY